MSFLNTYPSSLSRGGRVRPRRAVAAWRACLFGVFAAAGLCACAGYTRQTETFRGAFARGNLSLAVQEVDRRVLKREDSRDGLLWLLEQGAALRAAGRIEESNAAFDRADEKIREFEEKAKISVSAETEALFTNLASLPYRGRAYDKIMVSAYKAMNALQLGEPDKARVELRRAHQRQADAVEENARQIEKTQERARASKGEADYEQARNDPKFQGELQSRYADLDRYRGYKDYVNPLAELLQGMFFVAEGADASDREWALKSMERVAGMADDNPYARLDLEMADGVVQGRPIPPTTYVLFETGLAPMRDSFRIDVPVVLIQNRYVDYVGAAFPYLEFNPRYVDELVVEAGGRTHKTALLSDMDAVIAREFKNELSLLVTKTLVAAAAKATAAYAVREATRGQNVWIHLGARVVAAVYQVAVNQADERTWVSLPKQFQYCRFPTPAARRIIVRARGGGWSAGGPVAVELRDAAMNVVVVKSIAPGTPLIVSQFTLGKSSAQGVALP